MDKIILLADELSLIQQPMTDKGIIGCVLDELNLYYDVVVNNFHTMDDSPIFKKDLYCMFLNREK